MIFLSIGAVIAAAVGVGRTYSIPREISELDKKVSKEINTREQEAIKKRIENKKHPKAEEHDYLHVKQTEFEYAGYDDTRKTFVYDPIVAASREIFEGLDKRKKTTKEGMESSYENYRDAKASLEVPAKEAPELYAAARVEKKSSYLDEILDLIKNIGEKVGTKVGNYISSYETRKDKSAKAHA